MDLAAKRKELENSVKNGILTINEAKGVYDKVCYHAVLRNEVSHMYYTSSCHLFDKYLEDTYRGKLGPNERP